MKTLTDLELLKYAYDAILDRWYKKTKFNEAFKREHNQESPIASRRIEMYEKQIDELSELIIQEEKHLAIE